MSKYITTLDGVSKSLEVLKTKKIIGVDTETSGLNPLEESLLLIQVGDDRDQYVYDVCKLGAGIRDLFPIFENNLICLFMFIEWLLSFIHFKDYNKIKIII